MTDLRRPHHGLFVTGTNTEVGKTYAAALIARSMCASGHKVGVYKPAASGCGDSPDGLISGDAVALFNAAGQPGTLHDVCPQLFAAPLAPHLAAQAEGKEIDRDLLLAGIEVWADRCEVVLVEGAGGLLSPLGDDLYVADIALALGYPLVVVAANELGVINQTLQTLLAAKHYRDGLPVAAVVLNDCRWEKDDVSVASNMRQLQLHCDVPVLTHLPHRAESFRDEVDWMALTSRQPRWPNRTFQ
jgi:dethiobiotin synthetase